jgi:hypothetical protein
MGNWQLALGANSLFLTVNGESRIANRYRRRKAKGESESKINKGKCEILSEVRLETRDWSDMISSVQRYYREQEKRNERELELERERTRLSRC